MWTPLAARRRVRRRTTLLAVLIGTLGFVGCGGAEDGPSGDGANTSSPNTASGSARKGSSANASPNADRPQGATGGGQEQAGTSGGSPDDEAQIKRVVEEIVRRGTGDDPDACFLIATEALATIWEGTYEEGEGLRECQSGIGSWNTDTRLNFVDSRYPNQYDWKSVTNIQIEGDYAVGDPVQLNGDADRETTLEFVKQEGFEWLLTAGVACDVPKLRPRCASGG